jgi:hypothetical protein
VDLGIYNEATGFVITSRRMAGKSLDEGSAEWKKAVNRGDMLSPTLVQDDPFVVRVVAGAPLTAQEEEEWVARVDWHLNLPDGNLCVTGGSVLDHLAGGYDKGEPLEDWFARTRPGAPSPDADDLEHVDFLLHLEPVDAAPKTGISVLPNDGWFDGTENARKPQGCPLGLIATDVVRSSGDDETGRWTYVRDVFHDMPAVDRRAVKGETVSVPVEAMSRAVRIAWFGSRLTTVELRLTPPSNQTLDFSGDWPEGVVGVEEDGVGRVLFDADLDANGIIGLLPALAPRFAAQPPGTVVDLLCDALQIAPDRSGEEGRLALRGMVRDGRWRIAQAYPEADAATLNAALVLAALCSVQHNLGYVVVTVMWRSRLKASDAQRLGRWTPHNLAPHSPARRCGEDVISVPMPEILLAVARWPCVRTRTRQ